MQSPAPSWAAWPPARELGHTVGGSDRAIYPPMSTQLEQLGITLDQGYRADSVPPGTDEVVIGNALSRGNAAVEAVLDAGQRYISGAQWLSEQVLPGRDTLAVAGTHGKTTTTTILTAAGKCRSFSRFPDRRRGRGFRRLRPPGPGP